MSNVDCGACPHISDGCQGLCEKAELSVPRWSANWHMQEFYQSKHGDYVRASDYYSAQSELSALREELATSNKVGTAIGETLGRVAAERDDLHKRLTAAEQRNAVLVKAATEFMEYAESGWDHFPDVGVNLRAALAQPTESGASE